LTSWQLFTWSRNFLLLWYMKLHPLHPKFVLKHGTILKITFLTSCTPQLPRYCLQWAYPVEAPNILGAKSCTHFLVPGLFCHKIRPGPRLSFLFCNKLGVLWWWVNPHPTPKLEDHPLSVVRDCVFIIFTATLHIWRPSPPPTTQGHAMLWWQGTHLTW
jgi:hypothetical protein